MSNTKEYLTTILKGISTKPEEIVVEEFKSNKKTMYYIRCHKNDKGRIIGKGGRTIGAIQQLTYAFVRKDFEEGEDTGDVVRMSVEGTRG